MAAVASTEIGALVQAEAEKLLAHHRAQLAEAERNDAAGYYAGADAIMAGLPVQVKLPRDRYVNRLDHALANASAIAVGIPRHHGESDADYALRLAQAGAPIAKAADAMAALELLAQQEAADRKAEAERVEAMRRADAERQARAREAVERHRQWCADALAAEAEVPDADWQRAAEVLAIAQAGAKARESSPDAPAAPAGAVAVIEAATAR
jgi:hypothetical protein